MKINDNIRLNFIYDYENGRQVQLVITDPAYSERETLTGKKYIKVNLTDKDIFQIIQAIKTGLSGKSDDAKNLLKAFNKHLRVVKED